ncbi:MAG: PEGA domain-containing protein [Polyangiaceae bacterium]
MLFRRLSPSLPLLLLSLLFGGRSAADNGPHLAAKEAPTQAQTRDLAKAKYEQGVEAYRAERYADAVRSFLEADAISASAALSYNIARAYEKLSDDAQSLRWYRNYLRLDPQAQNATEVRGYVTALSAALAKKGIQQVSVLSAPPGATVAIDGNPLGVTPLTIELPPGAHTALLSLRGYSDATNDFTLPPASPIDVSVVLRATPKAAASSLAPTSPGARRFGVLPYVTLSVAGACLGAAGYYELSRRSAQNSAKNEQVQVAFQDDVNSIDSRRTAARVLLGVGSVLAVTGGALLLFNARISSESRAVVAGVPGGATLGLERRF